LKYPFILYRKVQFKIFKGVKVIDKTTRKK